MQLVVGSNFNFIRLSLLVLYLQILAIVEKAHEGSNDQNDCGYKMKEKTDPADRHSASFQLEDPQKFIYTPHFSGNCFRCFSKHNRSNTERLHKKVLILLIANYASLLSFFKVLLMQ